MILTHLVLFSFLAGAGAAAVVVQEAAGLTAIHGIAAHVSADPEALPGIAAIHGIAAHVGADPEALPVIDSSYGLASHIGAGPGVKPKN